MSLVIPEGSHIVEVMRPLLDCNVLRFPTAACRQCRLTACLVYVHMPYVDFLRLRKPPSVQSPRLLSSDPLHVLSINLATEGVWRCRSRRGGRWTNRAIWVREEDAMWGIEKSSRLGIVRGFEGLVRQPRSVDMMRQVLTPYRHQETLRLTFEKGTREE